MNPRNRRFRDDTTVQICGPQAQQPGAWRPHISQQQQQQAQNYARQRHREPWNRQHYHRNNRSNWGFNNNNRQAGTTSRHADDTRPRKHFQQSNNGIRPSDSTGDCESEFPDYTYDPVTKKYFKILPDSAGVHGYMRSEVAAKRNRDRLNTIAAHRPRVASGSFALRPVIQPVSKILSNAQIGLKSAIRPDIRYFESRLLNVSDKPSSTHDIDLSLSVSDRAFGCQFLDVSRDGRKLFGCWAVGDTSSNAQRNASRITCLDVEIDQRIIVKSALAAEDDPALEHVPRNYMGLKFTPTDFAWDVSDPNLVDMVTAQVDSDVTCVLYATATTLVTSRGLQNCCKVFLRPIPELCTVDDIDILSSPIYNMHWSSSDCVWSCGWNANKMRVGLGLEKAVKVIDVLANKNLYVSTNRKLVLSQEFEQQGNLVYLGLQAEDASCVDLRSNEISSRIRRARNVDFIKLLKDRDNQMVTDNFQGQLRVWDIRRLDRELFSLSGHSNSHYRLPVFVDPDEKAVFAVGQDGTTRGWSLRSGDLLCAVPCPRPVEARTDFPRVAFSDTWGGRAGNGALVLAVENSLRVHELNL